LIRKKRDSDYWAHKDALSKAVRQRRSARWPAKRDLVYNTDLKITLDEGIPPEHLALLQQQLDEFAVALGHNPSWSLDYKRKAMEGFVHLFKRAFAEKPHRYNMFTDLNIKKKWYLDEPNKDKSKEARKQ